MPEPSGSAPAPRPRRDPRNLVIAFLAILVILLGGVILADRFPGILAKMGGKPQGATVSVLDIVLDRDQLRFLDILFDRPLGAERVGDTLGRDPADLRPRLAGVWRWQSANLLRFEPSAHFEMATEYEVALLADRLLQQGQVFKGKTRFTVRTDQFQIERVDAYEEPAPTQIGGVIIRGEVRFNYAVDPRVLATKMRLVDPLRGESNPVPMSLETAWESEVIGFRSEPVPKQKTERDLRIVILSDLTPARGNVPLASDFTQKIPIGSNVVLSVRGVSATPAVPDSTIRIVLSSPVDPGAAGKYVTVTPPVSHRVSVDRNELLLTGPFVPGEEYVISIAQGLPAADESSLQEPFSSKLRMADLPPSFEFQSQGMFLSSSGYRTVAIESVNVDRVTLAIDRVYLNNLFFFFQYQWYDADEGYYAYSRVGHPFGDRLLEKTLDLGGARNQKLITPLALDKQVPAGEPGLYRITLSQADSYRGKQRWLLITDLGIVAKQGEEEFTVWISSFADLSPIAGAQVRLISDQNQTIATGRTDASGLWRASDLGALREKRRPYLVTVERGSDFSFLLLPRSGIDASGFDVGGATTPKGGYEAYVYGERDIYRPGETVEGIAVVRDRSLQIPPAMPILLRHKDPQGIERSTVRLAMDRKGLAPFKHPIPAYAPTGPHTLEVLAGDEVIGTYRFAVEEFVPDRIKVEIAPGKTALGPGETLDYKVTSAYLFGPPAAGLTVESRVRLMSALFAPKGYEGFVFENPERKFEGREIFSEEGKILDEEGERGFTIPIPQGLLLPSSLEAMITGRVQEQGGRGVAALQRVRVHSYRYYVGLRREGKTYADRGESVAFTWVAVAPDGSEAKAGPLRAEFFSDRWQTILRRTPAGDYRYDSVRDTTLIDTRSIEGGPSRGTFSFTPREFGSYRVALTDPATGASAQVEFYASGWGYSPWAIKDPGRIELDLDKDEYRSGESATVQVRAPFPGKILIAVERDRIYDTQIHTLAGNTAKITIPIRAEYRPNAYVTATLIRSARDLDPGAPGRAFGAVPLSVDRAANRMPVVVTAPDEIRPQTRLTVQVAAAPGSSVTVAAVDEGILQLIAQKTPDPFAHFYRKLALGVRGFDIFALLLPEVRPAGGKAATGGDEMMRGVAQFVGTEGIRRVEPVAFWSGVVEADAAGRASVNFDVPEFQGALRVMAVALGNDRFGSAEKMSRIRSPLVLLPTFPRFLSFGETALIPVTIRNDTGRDGSFDARLTAEGPVAIDGAASQAAAVPNGSERTVYFSVKSSEEPGNACFTLSASGNGETAATTTGLSLRADLPVLTLDKSGSFAQSSTAFPAEEAGSFRPATMRRDLRISPLPLMRFYGKLQYLLHYPYGCIEQTTSSAFPLVYLGDIAKEWDPNMFEKADPSVIVQEGIRHLSTMQIHNGGFAMWPGGTETHPWGSIYATHFLVEARRAGYGVESFLYDRAIQFLSGEVRAKPSYAAHELERTVYALYVLARAGKTDLGTMDFIRDRQGKALRPESRALLAAAYAAAGNTRALLDLLAGLNDVEEIRRQTGGNFDSTVRNRALLLLGFLDAAPSDPRVAQIAQRLARDAETARWWNTQETAFTFVALGQLFRRQAEKAPYSGMVFLGDRALGTFTNRTAVFHDIEGTAPIRVEMAPGYQEGAAFYALYTRGVPADEAFKPTKEGLEVTRSFLDRNGVTIDLGALTQGDLIVMKTQVRSLSGPLENVVLQNLLPSGLEVENPRLKSAESLPWITDANLDPGFLDYRDDRVILFLDLPGTEWRSSYALLRAVTPGSFRLPPVQAEAMYEPAVRATGDRGKVEVRTRK